MSVEYTRARTRKDLEEILELQKKNLPNHLTKQEIEKEGFLTVSHNLILLESMNIKCPHIIAKDKGRVIGYALCMHPDFSEEIPLLYAMFEKIREVLPEEQTFIVMGQICIETSYRRQGIFRGLYSFMKQVTASQFAHIITEVDRTNLRSLNAHYAIGFTLLKTYSADSKDWKLISIATQ
jgi:hypothetical protein